MTNVVVWDRCAVSFSGQGILDHWRGPQCWWSCIEARAGVDLSARSRAFTWLLGAYVARGPHRWMLEDTRLTDNQPSGDGFGGVLGIPIKRNEWTLSFPIGVALGSDEDAWGVLGLVPQITVEADRRTPTSYNSSGTPQASHFEQAWALYLTWSGYVVLGPGTRGHRP